MRIGDAAAAAGTTPRALRFYEERGLLVPPPVRTASGQREYGPRDVQRVRAVRDLLSLGLTVEDLARVADRLDLLIDGRATACTTVQTTGTDGREALGTAGGTPGKAPAEGRAAPAEAGGAPGEPGGAPAEAGEGDGTRGSDEASCDLGGGGVASARLAALDAEIARLTDLRARLAARLTGG